MSAELADTKRFTQALIERLGQKPQLFKPVKAEKNTEEIKVVLKPAKKETKELRGVDVFIHWDRDKRDPNVLGQRLKELNKSAFELKIISNRGVGVFPDYEPDTFCSDHWRIRYTTDAGTSYSKVLELLDIIDKAGFDIIQTENLYYFNGQRAYSLGQGES
jgi:isocitrate dehydrogenase